MRQQALGSSNGGLGAEQLGTGPSTSESSPLTGGTQTAPQNPSGPYGRSSVSGAPGSTDPTSAGGGSGSANRPGAPLAGNTQANGPGVTGTTINIAGIYLRDAAAANQALGAANQNPGDTKAAQEAVLRYINTHGGVAGRQLRYIWYEASATASETDTSQAACSAWTEDAKTFVLGSGNPIIDACAAKAHALGLTEGIMGSTTPTMRKYPTIVNITGFTTDRAARLTIRGLLRQGYINSTSKVGIATWDESDYRYGISHGAAPALAAAGLRDVPVSYIAVPRSTGDLGATSAAISNAVLKFRSAGIDHVILLDGQAGAIGPGYLVLEWMHNAESQHWYPRYGLNSNSGFSTLAPNLPPNQMKDSIGVGWVPIADQAPEDQGPALQSARAKLCLKIMRDAGQPSNTNNQKTLQFYYCDFLFFLKDALDSVTGPLNEATAMEAINQMGNRYVPLSTFGTRISATQHDAADLVRNIAFYPACTCYRYTSAPYRAD